MTVSQSIGLLSAESKSVPAMHSTLPSFCYLSVCLHKLITHTKAYMMHGLFTQ